MHASHVLIGLIATVSAIDIYGYRNNEKCGGTDRVVCTNVNPGTCCPRASGNTWRAIGFQAIPTNWQIVGSGYTGGDCKNIWHSEVSNGRQNMCCGGYNYSGGKYSFASKKRGITADSVTDACPAAEGGCTEVAKASLMELEGAKYNLTGLDEALYNEMVSKSNHRGFSFNL